MQALPPKKEVALALLQRSSMFIHLDPRSDAVRVPPWFKKQAQLVLQVGLNMAVAIRDLEVDDEAISCTLSFNRTPHFCFMPFSAVYALVGEDGRGMVWPDDVPPEVAAQANGKGSQQQSPRKRSHLRAVGDDEQPESSDLGADAVGPDAASVDPLEVSAEASAGQTPAAPKRAPLRSVAPVTVLVSEPADVEPAEPTASVVADADDSDPVDSDSADPQPTGADPADPQPTGADPVDADLATAPVEPDNGKRKLPPYLRIVK